MVGEGWCDIYYWRNVGWFVFCDDVWFVGSVVVVLLVWEVVLSLIKSVEIKRLLCLKDGEGGVGVEWFIWCCFCCLLGVWVFCDICLWCVDRFCGDWISGWLCFCGNCLVNGRNWLCVCWVGWGIGWGCGVYVWRGWLLLCSCWNWVFELWVLCFYYCDGVMFGM